MPNKYVTNECRKSDLSKKVMDNDADMVIIIKVPRKWVIYVNGVWSDIKKVEIKRYKFRFSEFIQLHMYN